MADDSDAACADSTTILPCATVDYVVGGIGVLATAMTDVMRPFTVINVTIHIAISTITTSHVIHPVA